MQNIDTLVKAGWIITVNQQFDILENHSIAIHQGKIIDIFPSSDNRYKAENEHILSDHILMPGLINSHGHAAMSLFRGLTDDIELMQWLETIIWPAEQKYVDENFVRCGTQLAAAEMIKSGTSCFSDMYFFPEVAAGVAEDMGIRAQMAFPIFDVPSNWGSGAEEYLQKGLKVIEQYQDSELVNIAFGPHAPYTISDKPLKQIAELSRSLNCKVQMHLHETAFEVETAVNSNKERPIARMQRLGLLNEHFQAVHMTTLNPEDISMVKHAGSHVIHCPESNLKLASGFAPVHQLLEQNINVALGTDGASSNNDLDMFSEMKTAALLGKAVAQNATALPAETAIKMATINGAKALGIDSQTGSLETGKSADFIAIKANQLTQTPLYNPCSQIVYTNISQHVSHHWIKGKLLLENHQLTEISEADIINEAQQWKDKLISIKQG